ncbi:MAG: ABC transporter ATP-binding protein [Nitratireductor sp.]|nr:ABC transporter ATP-binding protein [Nitratireductor sp.]
MTKHRKPILEVKNLTTGYGDLVVVRDLSFEVYPGEITVLLGRNGAGKTSSLRALGGLNPLLSGSIRLGDVDLGRVPAAARVRMGLSYVQEGKRVFHKLSVEQNLLLGGYSLPVGRRQIEGEIERIYGLFPILKQKRHDKAGSMSGGQQQMLAIGQALMAQPKVLLLDEPSGGLAPVIVNEVFRTVDQLKDEGLAVLLVEQAVEASLEIADSVTVLDVGHTVFSARTEERDDMLDAVKEAYMGHPTS